MADPLNLCDIERLRLLLADQLPEPLRTEVAEHLGQCTMCRETLESLAGDANWWSEVESCFRTNCTPAGSSDQEELSQLSDVAHSSSDSFSADFVVDFLDPCDQPGAIGRLGEYEILEVIGRGGMGVVLKGFHRELGRYVAVKVIAPHLAASGAARQRFIREARAAAAIVHPNVMPIHTVCTTTRLPYLVMPFVACESLQQRVDQQGPLDLKEILRIGSQVSAGLSAAHAQGLVHRDIKPANILLEKGVDRVMLTDFGLARAADDGSLTRTGVVTGTPQYMSPEQAQGDPIDMRSDLFSLGSVLYTMSTGRPPFRAETALGILRRISDTKPRPVREIHPEAPEWLERIIQRLHEKHPAARFQTSAEVAELLERCLAHVQQPNFTPLPESLRLVEAARDSNPMRRRTLFTVAVLVTVCLLTALVLVVFPHDPPQPGPASLHGGPDSTAAANGSRELSDEIVTKKSQDLEIDLREFEQRASQEWGELDTAAAP